DTRLQPVSHAVDGRSSTVPVAPGGGRYSLAQLLGTYDALLDEVMPPSLLVTERGELVHVFGGASKFLRPRDGRQALEVLDFVDGELKMILSGGLKRATMESSAIVFKGVRLGSDAASYKITIRRVEVRAAPPGAGHLLISFEPTESRPRSAPSE